MMPSCQPEGPARPRAIRGSRYRPCAVALGGVGCRDRAGLSAPQHGERHPRRKCLRRDKHDAGIGDGHHDELRRRHSGCDTVGVPDQRHCSGALRHHQVPEPVLGLERERGQAAAGLDGPRSRRRSGDDDAQRRHEPRAGAGRVDRDDAHARAATGFELRALSPNFTVDTRLELQDHDHRRASGRNCCRPRRRESRTPEPECRGRQHHLRDRRAEELQGERQGPCPRPGRRRRVPARRDLLQRRSTTESASSSGPRSMAPSGTSTATRSPTSRSPTTTRPTRRSPSPATSSDADGRGRRASAGTSTTTGTSMTAEVATAQWSFVAGTHTVEFQATDAEGAADDRAQGRHGRG